MLTVGPEPTTAFKLSQNLAARQPILATANLKPSVQPLTTVRSTATEKTPPVTAVKSKPYIGYNSIMDFSGLVVKKQNKGSEVFTFQYETEGSRVRKLINTFESRNEGQTVPKTSRRNQISVKLTDEDKADIEERKTNPIWQEMMRNAHAWAVTESKKGMSASATKTQENEAFSEALSNVPISEAFAWVTVKMKKESLVKICEDAEARAIYDPRITTASTDMELGYLPKDAKTGKLILEKAPKNVSDDGKLPDSEAYEDTYSACADNGKQILNPLFEKTKNSNLAVEDKRRTRSTLVQISIKIRPTTILRKDRYLGQFDFQHNTTSRFANFLSKKLLKMPLTHAAMDIGGLTTEFGAHLEKQDAKTYKVETHVEDPIQGEIDVSTGLKKMGQLHLYQYRKFHRFETTYIPWVVEILGEVSTQDLFSTQSNSFDETETESAKSESVKSTASVLRVVEYRDGGRAIKHVSTFGRQMIKNFLTLNQRDYGMYRNEYSTDNSSKAAWHIIMNNCQKYVASLGKFLIGAKA